MKGILITCTRGKEAQCVREAINVFSEVKISLTCNLILLKEIFF